MATEERLPPACAFALSVLAERDQDPDAVPEEAVEAAQQHIATCARCITSTNPTLTTASTPAASTTVRKKKKVRRAPESSKRDQSPLQTLLDETTPLMPETEQEAAQDNSISEQTAAHPLAVSPGPRAETITIKAVGGNEESADTGGLDCQQCRELLAEYAEAMDSGKNVALLYPEMQEHLLSCESGCLILLDLFRQEAKATRKYRRKPVRDPFSAIYWELTGFFRGGQVPMSPIALAYGTLILLQLVASLSAYLGFNWNESRYHPAHQQIPTPDGIGLSDGLKVFDACNATGYQYKRQAAQQMQDGNLSKADSLLTSAITATQSDTTGCNSGEAAIYRENLHVRQSGRPFGIVVVSFDSGPGNADPEGGTDRHILYAAYTQELVGAFIAQHQYNTTQLQTPGAPLLYLVLANTTGVESGALQIANTVASLAKATDVKPFGLLTHDQHPLLAVLGLGPSSLVRVVLPVMCRAGVPIIAPTTTGLFIIDLLTQTSLYRHCTPGFAFIRFSPDDAAQSALGANYAYNTLKVQSAAIFYDPSNPSSQGSAQGFSDTFSKFPKAHIVARETAVASGLLDANGRPQASREDLLAGLNDALQARPRPNLIFASLLTNDVTTLAQAIARLPQDQQPILMIGGEFVQPAALQGLVQWARQNQLSLPKVFVSISAAARPPTDGDWQKQFYASFCTSFATPGSYCSGAAALDQGALLFGDGIEIVTQGVGPITDASKLPTEAQLVQHISQEKFAGVGCPIALRLRNDVLVTSTTVHPVILGLQEDGSIQILS